MFAQHKFIDKNHCLQVKGPGGARGLLAGHWAENVAINHKQELHRSFTAFHLWSLCKIVFSITLPILCVTFVLSVKLYGVYTTHLAVCHFWSCSVKTYASRTFPYIVCDTFGPSP